MEIELYFLCAMHLKKLSTHVNPHSRPLHIHHYWSCPEKNENMFAPSPVAICILLLCVRWLPCSGSRPELLVFALGAVMEVVSPLTTHLLDKFQSDSVPSESSPSSRMSPAVLFIVVVLAVLLFISGLLHFILRCFIRKRHPRPSSSRSAPELSGSDALQRQLQQLFHLHDSGVDQALIDALPVFLYKDVVGSKEPLECAVCLCEFDGEDELRLLPVCGHAFHLSCIDTWLLSNSTCPLCRGSLFPQGMAVEDPVFLYLGDSTDEGEASPAERAAAVAADEGDEIAADRRRVFHVRLGKFRNLGNGNVGGDCNEDNSIAIGSVRREEGETSSSSLTARRCVSMGSYQYVVADAQLQVALKGCSALRNGDGRGITGTDARGNSPGNEAVEGERLSIGSRHECFSESKVWLWSNKKGEVSMSSDTSALDTNSPWKTEAVGLKVTEKLSMGSARSKSEGPTSTACAVEGAAVDVPVAAAAAVLLCPTRKNKTGNTAPKIAAVDDHVPDKSLPIELKSPSSVFSASSLAGIIHSASQEKHTKNLPHGKTISIVKKIAAQYKCKGPLRNPISPHKKSGKEISSHLDNGNEIRYKLLLAESRSSSSPLCVTSTEWGSIPSLLPSNTVSTVYPLSNFISGRWPETAAGNAGGIRDHNLFSREEAALEAALETATPTISTRPKQQENELVMRHRKAKKEQNTHLQVKRQKQSCTHPARSKNCLRCMKHLKSFNLEDGKEEGLNLVSKQRPSECTDST
ncbi:unnamed protein product [Musa acuminata var. zebrina]